MNKVPIPNIPVHVVANYDEHHPSLRRGVLPLEPLHGLAEEVARGESAALPSRRVDEVGAPNVHADENQIGVADDRDAGRVRDLVERGRSEAVVDLEEHVADGGEVLPGRKSFS